MIFATGASTNGWTKVSFNGRTAYVYSTYLKAAGTTASAAPAVKSASLTATTASSANAATADTIWGTGAPTSAVVDSDSSAVELGTRFTAVTTGQATSIRFYKTPENTGTHTGSLWTSSGTLLGRVTFAGEASSGWQTAALSSPITLTAGTGYVVSYHATVGRYLATESFTGTSASPNLRIPTSNVGVYSYGTSSAFPTSSWHSSQYWVDLSFSTAQSTTTTTSTPIGEPPTTPPPPQAPHRAHPPSPPRRPRPPRRP